MNSALCIQKGELRAQQHKVCKLHARAADRSEQSHAHEHAILRLLKVNAARVVIHSRHNLVDTRQWVHHNHLLLAVLQRVRCDNVHTLQRLSEFNTIN